MYNEDLVVLVAEHIYNNYYRDTKTGIKTLDFYQLPDEMKHMYCSMATNIIAIVLDWYDAENETDLEDMDDEDFEIDLYGDKLEW